MLKIVLAAAVVLGSLAANAQVEGEIIFVGDERGGGYGRDDRGGRGDERGGGYGRDDRGGRGDERGGGYGRDDRGGRGDERGGGYGRDDRGGRDDRDGGYGRDRGVRCTITTTNYNIYHGRGRSCEDAQRDVIGECVQGQKARGVQNWDRCLHSVRPGRKYTMSCSDGCGY